MLVCKRLIIKFICSIPKSIDVVRVEFGSILIVELCVFYIGSL
jgi:hypothetical protein